MKMLTVMSNLQKLPCSLSDGFPTTDLQALLAMELANFKNYESLSNLLTASTEILI